MGACFSSGHDAQHTKEHHEKHEHEKHEHEKHENEKHEQNSEYDRQHSLQDDDKSVGDEIQELPTIKIPPKLSVYELRQNLGNSNLDCFTYDEMRMTTKLFRRSEVLGEGGFGVVYKGLIDDVVRDGYTTTEVAVKKLNPDGTQGDSEWLAEVNYLGHLQHPNITKLIGYCCEANHRILVYEFMENGSVEDHLFGKGRRDTSLTWSRRVKVALDAAKGLDFLHNSRGRIIFRDFKTSNILLDSNFNAKLSDFGLARDGPTGAKTHVSTRTVGTRGYAAPEFLRSGHLSASCDIYAFGVVLLELMTGNRAFDESLPFDDQLLVDRDGPCLVQGKSAIAGILDPRLRGQCSFRSVHKVAELVLKCLKEKPKTRPTMSKVVEALELAMEIL